MRRLAHLLFGQNFGAVVQVVTEDPDQLGYELRTDTIPETAQADYLRWVASLPEAERV